MQRPRAKQPEVRDERRLCGQQQQPGHQPRRCRSTRPVHRSPGPVQGGCLQSGRSAVQATARTGRTWRRAWRSRGSFCRYRVIQFDSAEFRRDVQEHRDCAEEDRALAEHLEHVRPRLVRSWPSPAGREWREQERDEQDAVGTIASSQTGRQLPVVLSNRPARNGQMNAPMLKNMWTIFINEPLLPLPTSVGMMLTGVSMKPAARLRRKNATIAAGKRWRLSHRSKQDRLAAQPDEKNRPRARAVGRAGRPGTAR